VEVDFLVIDVPTAYNIIIGRPTLYKVKAVITSYLLRLQFEADDGSVGTMQGDHCTTRVCLVIIWPLVKWMTREGLAVRRK